MRDMGRWQNLRATASRKWVGLQWPSLSGRRSAHFHPSHTHLSDRDTLLYTYSLSLDRRRRRRRVVNSCE